MKVFLSVASVLIVLFGVAWLLFPDTMVNRWGVQTDATGVYLGRRYGAVLIGLAGLLWLGRGAGPSAARTAILGGGALVTALVTLVSLAGVVTGTVGPGGWVSLIVEAALTAGFLYFVLARRTQSQGKPAL